MNTYIAIDIGASSGRLVKSSLIDGKIQMEEIYRFKNGFSFKNNHERWDIDYLTTEILKGLSVAKKQGLAHCYLGIDTWAVDYCLLDEQGQLIDQPISYRDARTNEGLQSFSQKMSLEKLYEKTGIQIQPFNTIFQLFVEEKERLEQAKTLLLIPDYLGYVFTGKKVTEKTNASTMQLLNANTQTWDEELLELIQVDATLFPPLVEAGTVLGELLIDKFPEHDLPAVTIINVASHDTASAVLGTPGYGENWAYISSGTWSLLGIETTIPNVSLEAFHANYTNEWGAHNTIRFLKNIMGMWLIQEVARMQDYQYSYAQLAELAANEAAFQQFIDVNDPRFLNPVNMIEELQAYCQETNQVVPVTPGELARCVYDNLALCYATELKQLEKLSGTEDKIETLHIVGGGSNNRFLNQLTANATQTTVIAGPGEATAIGNLVMQMLSVGEFSTVEAARKAIENSFTCETYEPEAFEASIFVNYLKTMQR